MFTGLSRGYKSLVMDRLLRKHANDIFLAAVNSVRPNRLIDKFLEKSGLETVNIGDQTYELKKNVYVVGFGKATLGMARAVENKFCDHIVSGIVSVPQGIQDIFKQSNQLDLLLGPATKLTVFEGAANNLPDSNAEAAAKAIYNLIIDLKETDLLVVLISGGGSALLPAPIPPVTLQEKCEVIGLLNRHGANINELNTVRKQLSLLKGGGFAKLAYPAKVLSFILSDVINDPLDIIASGPTVPNPNSLQDVMEIIERYGIQNKLPSSVIEVLSKTPMKSVNGENAASQDFNHVHNYVIGSNTVALRAAEECATILGYCTVCLTNSLEGEAREVGHFFAQLAHSISKCYSDASNFKTRIRCDRICQFISSQALDNLENVVLAAARNRKPICVLAGGETTVTIKGSGKGGRNQELVLSCGIHLQKLFAKECMELIKVVFLSAGTDGIDGPTDAAGASTNHVQISSALELGFDAENYLSNNDSNTFFVNAAKESIIKTGHTGTNVMDIQVLVVLPEFTQKL